MADQRLVDYIKSELSRGTSLNQIRQSLLSQGWSDYDIYEAVDLATQQRTFPATSKPTMYEEPTKKSSKLWIISVLVVITLIIGGVFAFFMLTERKTPETTTPTTPLTQEPREPSGPTDCGTNMDCFIQASQNCNPAKVTHIVTTDILGVKQTTTSYYEIKGLEAGKCVFYLRTEKIDLTFPPEIPQDIVDQQKEIYKKLEGRDGSCKFNTNDLAAMLSRWKEGNFEGDASCTLVGDKWECTYTGDWEVAEECQGTYFSQEL